MQTITHTYYCDEPDGIAQAVAAHIRRHNLLRGVRHLGIAVSGGADSVALLHLLPPLCRESDTALTVLHLNHGLRSESAEEEVFVRQLCAAADVPVRVDHARLAEQPKNGLSLEMAARDKRMEFYRECCRALKLDAIATGHNADDVAETLLLRLMRGTGPAGLSGLKPASEIHGRRFIRPLLTISAQALRQWLRERDLAWREDASNRDTAIQRNHIRHKLLPQIEKGCQTGVRARLCRTAEILRCEDLLLEEMAKSELEHICANLNDTEQPLTVAHLLEQPLALQRRILRQWLFRQVRQAPSDFESVTKILELCDQPGDWKRDFAGNVTAVCRGGLLTVSYSPPPPDIPAPIELSWDLAEPVCWGNIEISLVYGSGIHDLANGIGTYPAVCSLNASILQGRKLQVRARLPGDHISPTGFTGTKKVKGLFIDAKVPQQIRDTIPLLACDGEIVWIPGYRIDRRFAVPSQTAPSVIITIRRA